MDDQNQPVVNNTSFDDLELQSNQETKMENQNPTPDLATSSPSLPVSIEPVLSSPTMEPVLSSPTQVPSVQGQNLTMVAVERIAPNPWQPRKIFKEEYLRELADSIKEHGILQPLVVVPQPDGNYQLIVGERRLRASQLAGLTHVPVIVRDAMQEQQKLELALIENIQRHNLDPIEEGQAYQQLIDQYKLTQEEVAKKVGKGRPTISNMIRLLNLPLKIQRGIADGVISEGHGRAILGLVGMEKQLSMFDLIVTENFTVRQAEDRVREIMERPKMVRAVRGSSDPEVQAIESELRGKLGTKVKVQKAGETRRITLEFFSEDELRHFMEKMDQLPKI